MNHASRWTGVALAAALAGSLGRSQTTELVSVATGGAQSKGWSHQLAISADGRFVAFQTFAWNLDAGDTNYWDDVYVHDRQSGTTERVSVATGGAQGDADSFLTSISADGRFVGFSSDAAEFVAGDTNGTSDSFVRDRQSGMTERVSVATGGAQADLGSYGAWISANGRFVAFWSYATNLVAGDTNGFVDVFVRDRQNGTTERVSVATDGTQGNSQSDLPSISADGRFVAFQSFASSLAPGGSAGVDVFVRDRLTGTTECVRANAGGTQWNMDSRALSISADGRFVAFHSYASDIVAGDSNGFGDIFMHDRQSGTTERVSVATGGAQGNSECANPSTSADGRFVAFSSDASNLIAGDSNGFWDVFVRDRQTGTTERVSVASSGSEGNSYSWGPSISADGRLVAFASPASNLVAGDTNGLQDAFVRDRGQPPIFASCFGDGTEASCPCGNNGLAGHGCENSSGTGGAMLSASGSSSFSSDSLVLTASGEKPTALSIFLQGSELIAPVVFGDGLRCAGGALERLFYVQIASNGVATAPQGSDLPISVRSAALGDPIPMGATRHYQTYYRDAVAVFCPSPSGNSWNVTNALSAVWSP